MTAWRSTLVAGIVSIAATLLVGVAAPGFSAAVAVPEWSQVLAGLAAAGACAAAAAHTRGRARVVWALFAAGQVLWAATDAASGIWMATGATVPTVSPLTIGWLGVYVPMLGATVILYRRLRPERGWQGVLDGLIVTVAIVAIAWTTILAPVSSSGPGGLAGTLIVLLYPVLDLTCFAALGWVLLRSRSGAPTWLRCVVAAFGLQGAAGLAHVIPMLYDHDATLLAASVSIGASTCWALAGVSRRGAAQRAWTAGRHDAPPVWSQIAPFVLGGGIVLLGAARPEPEMRIAAALAAVLVSVRAMEAMRVARGLLSERDRLLVIDPLTGAFNRRFLTHESERAFNLARRSGDRLAAIALDLDHFKSVNDRLGHGVGDRLLAAVASTIRQQLRSSDLLCRLGGDEFIVLCPGTDADGAMVVAERIRVRVRERAAREVPEMSVTTSLGVAAFPADGADPAALFRAADEALYTAKQRGRDLTARYEAPELVAG